MARRTSKVSIPDGNSGAEAIPPTRWTAESQGEVVGGVELTSRGKYRATNHSGRLVGVFSTLSEARENLENSTTRRQLMNQSRTLQIIGLVAFCIAAVAAAVGVFLLFIH